MTESLTNRAFWAEYWKNHRFVRVKKNIFFEQLTRHLNGSGKHFIELGGFPGYNCVYFSKYLNYSVSFLDFYVDEQLVRQLEMHNQIPANSIHCIESDLFAFETDKRYDMVFSCGLIEHFDNTADVIERHYRLVAEGGQLMILIPNFRGLNGLIQKWFDRENLEKHNLQSMKLDFLAETLASINVKNAQVFYFGKPMLWLEPKVNQKMLAKLIKLLSYAIKLFPFKGRFLSPYIAITAEK